MLINYYYHEKLNILKLFKVVKKLIYKFCKFCQKFVIVYHPLNILNF